MLCKPSHMYPPVGAAEVDGGHGVVVKLVQQVAVSVLGVVHQPRLTRHRVIKSAKTF